MEKLAQQILSKTLAKRSWRWPKNWVLKCLSLLFAIFLWYFVVGEDKVDMTVQIPIEIVNLPHNLVISNQFKKQLEVTVSGPRGLIRGIDNQHISRPVDMSKATAGTLVVRNDADSIPFPRGVKVLRIQPTHVIFLLDRLIHRDLPVTPRLTGKPPKNYELASVKIDPPFLTITGPQSILSGLQELQTMPIDISQITGSEIEQATLDLKPEVADLIGEPVVTAKIMTQEITEAMTFKNLPITIINANPGQTITVSPMTVTVKTQLPISLKKEAGQPLSLLTPTVKAGDLDPGRHIVAVTVETVKPFAVTDIAPSTVTLEITPQGQQGQGDKQ